MMLNLGCGEDHRDGFINADIREDVSPDVLCDATNLPFDRDSFEVVIARDVLEHFPNPIDVLKEWERVVEPGGALVAQVPDWNVLGDKNYWKQRDIKQIEKNVYGGHKNDFDQHHTLWTKELAEERAWKAGFDNSYSVELRTPPKQWHLCIVAYNHSK